MAFNTNNPLGSTDPRDLSDNAENLDRGANGTATTFTDRLGISRQSWKGMETEFNVSQDDRQGVFRQYLISAGYQFAGNYGVGIQITQYNEVVQDSFGEFWRASGSTALPYTTTGAGMPEGGAFVAVGDATLRNELAQAISTGGGATLVNGATIYVGSVAELVALSNPTDGAQYDVTGYHAGSDVGGGKFYWDASRDKADHTGGNIIDPDKTFPTDWENSTQVSAWFTADGTGTGCYVRPDGLAIAYRPTIYTTWFGAFNNDKTISSHLQTQQAIDYGEELSTRTEGGCLVIAPAGKYGLANHIQIHGSGLSFEGEGWQTEFHDLGIKANNASAVAMIESLHTSAKRPSNASVDGIKCKNMRLIGIGESTSQIMGMANTAWTRNAEISGVRANGFLVGFGGKANFSWKFCNNYARENKIGVGFAWSRDDGGAFTALANLPEYSGALVVNATQFNGNNVISNDYYGLVWGFGNGNDVSGANTFELNGINVWLLGSDNFGAFTNNYVEGSTSGPNMILGDASGGILKRGTIQGNIIFLPAAGFSPVEVRGLTEAFCSNNRSDAVVTFECTGPFQRVFNNDIWDGSSGFDADHNSIGNQNSGVLTRNGFSVAGRNPPGNTGRATLTEIKMGTINGVEEATISGKPYLIDPLNVFSSGTEAAIFRGENAGGGESYAKKLKEMSVSTTATTIAVAARHGFVVVSGADQSASTTSFIDVVIFVSFGGATVVSSQARGGPAARTYTVSGSGLELSMASGTYNVVSSAEALTS